MANIKVSELPSATSLNDEDLVMIVQNNESKKINGENLLKRNIYSTDEIVIGKWVNNKPIYRQVFTGTINDASVLLQNVDALVNSYGTVYINNNTRPLNYYEMYNNLQYFVNLRVNSNKVYMACLVAGQPYNPSDCKITLEYTKTTD